MKKTTVGIGKAYKQACKTGDEFKTIDNQSIFDW
jgi:hypothetical protein